MSMASNDVQNLIELMLLSGKCVLLVGAPGTGKTRLAIEVCRRLTGCEPRVVVGRGDLSYEDLVYRYELRDGSTKIVLGELALSILASWIRLVHRESPIWLVLDEVNRFNADLVLGDLFIGLDLEHRRRAKILPLDMVKTIGRDEDLCKLITDIVQLDENNVRKALQRLENVFRRYGYLPIPYLWRALATMNIVDRSHLYRLGFAFSRRFSMILFPSVFRNFRSELNDSTIEAEASVPSRAIDEAYRELALSSQDIDVPSDRVLYSITLTRGTVEEAVKRFERVAKVFNYIAKEMDSLGIDLGYSIYVDLCRLLTVAHLLNYDDESQLADLAVSSLLLPHVGSIAPKLRAELLLMGRTRRIDALANLFDRVATVLGIRSRSAYYCEVLSLEVPAAIR